MEYEGKDDKICYLDKIIEENLRPVIAAPLDPGENLTCQNCGLTQTKCMGKRGSYFRCFNCESIERAKQDIQETPIQEIPIQTKNINNIIYETLKKFNIIFFIILIIYICADNIHLYMMKIDKMNEDINMLNEKIIGLNRDKNIKQEQYELLLKQRDKELEKVTITGPYPPEPYHTLNTTTPYTTLGGAGGSGQIYYSGGGGGSQIYLSKDGVWEIKK